MQTNAHIRPHRGSPALEQPHARPGSPPAFFRCCQAAVLLGLLLLVQSAGPALGSDRKRDAEAVEIGPPPPMAQSVQISLYKGETIEIPLQARGRVPLDTKFLLRSRPRAGELSAIQMEGPGRGRVTYRHTGEAAPAEDSFTYAAQAGDSPVSAPARVRIFILERPAELVVTESLDFGRGLLGRGEERFITLANAGGATFVADLKVDEGWEIAGEQKVEIAGGEAVRVAIRFRPDQERSYLGALRFSHDEKVFVRLSGEGVDPVRWFPQSLAWAGPEERGKIQELVVENRSGEAIEIFLEGGPGVFLPEAATIEPGSQARIEVRPDPAQRQGAQGAIRLKHPFGEAKIPYQVAAAPAQLDVTPTAWDIGEVLSGQEVETDLLVRNVGGVATVVVLTPPVGVEVDGALDRPLAPDAEEKFTLRFIGRAPGVYERELEIRHGATARSWPVRAKVREEENGLAGEKAGVASGFRPEKPAPPAAEIFGLSDLQPAERTKTSVGFEWTQEIAPEDRLLVEERLLGVSPGGGLAIDWRATEQIQLTRMPDHRWRATVVGMIPGGRKYLRVHWINAEGVTLGISETFVVETEPRAVGRQIPWRSLALLALSGAAVWLWWRRRGKGDPETEARLRNLEKGP